MKIKKVLLLSVFLLGTVLAYAQNVSMHVQGVTVKKAMTILQKQSGYLFVYEQSDLDLQKKVNVNATTLSQALRQIFTGQNVSYEINGKNVVVARKSASVPQ